MRPQPPLGAAQVFAPPAATTREHLAPRSTLALFARMAAWSSLAYGIPMGLLFGGAWSLTHAFHAWHLAAAILGTGLAFGIPFSAFMMLFQHEIVVDVPCPDPGAFSARLADALKGAGYHPPEADGSILVSRPTWKAGKASGSIRIGIHDTTATLVGPRHYLRKVERALAAA
jgi:hypothetical protein